MGSLRRMSIPNSPDLTQTDYHVWDTMLRKYHEIQSKPKTTDEFRVVLQTIWEELPQEHVNKAVAIFTKCLTDYLAVSVNGNQKVLGGLLFWHTLSHVSELTPTLLDGPIIKDNLYSSNVM